MELFGLLVTKVESLEDHRHTSLDIVAFQVTLQRHCSFQDSVMQILPMLCTSLLRQVQFETRQRRNCFDSLIISTLHYELDKETEHLCQDIQRVSMGY